MVHNEYGRACIYLRILAHPLCLHVYHLFQVESVFIQRAEGVDDDDLDSPPLRFFVT
jgi:hypothetical protein